MKTSNPLNPVLLVILYKIQKALLKVVEGLPLSKHFNDVISMDLQEINGH